MFCGVGRDGGRQLEGITINRQEQEGRNLFVVRSLSHSASLCAATILLTLADTIRAWVWTLGGTEPFLSSLSCAGKGKNTQTNQKCRLRQKPSESTFSPGVPGSPW